MIDKSRRDGVHHRGEEGASAAEPAPHEPDDGDHDHAKKRHLDAGAPIVHPEQEVHERVEDELEGAVHHGLMLVAAAVEELERVDRVEALVVAHGARAEHDRACQQRDQHQRDPGDLLAVEPQKADEGPVQKAGRFGVGVLHIRHRCLFLGLVDPQDQARFFGGVRASRYSTQRKCRYKIGQVGDVQRCSTANSAPL